MDAPDPTQTYGTVAEAAAGCVRDGACVAFSNVLNTTWAQLELPLVPLHWD